MSDDKIDGIDAKLARWRDQSTQTFLTSTAAAHNSANWLLAASTTANSAGFYFAMSAATTWLTVSSALAFMLAISSTFVCGRFVTTIHAMDADAADVMRRAEPETLAQITPLANASSDVSESASGMLDNWTTITILLTTLGGVLLVAGKAGELL